MGIQAFKTVVTIPWELQNSFEGTTKTETVFSTVPLIYRAVRLRCNSLVQVPLYIYDDNDKVLKEYPFESTLPMLDWLWLNEAAILLKGASYTLRLSNKSSFPKGLQWLNPFTVEVKQINGQLQFNQQTGGMRFPSKGYWTQNEMIYLREFNPSDDIGPGISPCEVALPNAQLMEYITRFAKHFFQYGAMPVTVASIPGNPIQAERERFETKLKQMITNVRNAFRVIATSGEVKFDKLTPEIDTMALEQLDIHAVNNIAWAFDIPKTLLTSDSANSATAGIEYRNFLAHTISARCKFYESRLNKFLNEYGCRIEFAVQELDEMQEDETNRALSLKYLVETGIPLKAALDILGYDLSKYAMDELEEALKKKEELPPTVVATNVANSQVGEPRPNTIKAGARHNSSDMNDIRSIHDKAEEIKSHALNLGHPKPEKHPVWSQMMKADIDKWYRKSISNFKANKIANVDFDSAEIPGELKLKIAGFLSSAKTEDEIALAFNGELT